MRLYLSIFFALLFCLSFPVFADNNEEDDDDFYRNSGYQTRWDDYNDRITPANNTLTQKECSECHMVYPPGLVPGEAWVKLMSNLQNHFGEDATVDEVTRKAIELYLIKNSPVTPLWLNADNIPLRIITNSRGWMTDHDRSEVNPKYWNRIRKANCTACHPGAVQGYFDDD